MNTRRTFIRTSLAATAGMFCANQLLAMAAEGKSKLKKFGFISGIFKEAKKQSIEHYIVERDNEPDGLGCLQSSAEYLKDLQF